MVRCGSASMPTSSCGTATRSSRRRPRCASGRGASKCRSRTRGSTHSRSVTRRCARPMSRPRTAADRGRVCRVRAAGLALACGVLNVASAAAVAPAPGLPLHATRQVTFETDRGTWLSVDVAPNGRDLVFDMLGDLYRLDIAGGRARAITRGLAFDSQPAWSPDGEWLAFLSDRGGAENVWVMRPDGSGARQVTANDQSYEYISPRWSHDGRTLFVSQY